MKSCDARSWGFKKNIKYHETHDKLWVLATLEKFHCSKGKPGNGKRPGYRELMEGQGEEHFFYWRHCLISTEKGINHRETEKTEEARMAQVVERWAEDIRGNGGLISHFSLLGKTVGPPYSYHLKDEVLGTNKTTTQLMSLGNVCHCTPITSNHLKFLNYKQSPSY